MLNFVAPINTLSYGYSACYLLESLYKLQTKVSLFPVSQIQCENRFKEVVSKSLEFSKYFNYDAPCLRLWHANDMSIMVGKGPHIGFPIFELDTLTEVEVHHLNSLDHVIVCSAWAKKVIIENTHHEDHTVHVVPLGVDNQLFVPAKGKSETTRFFNAGKWEVRKGHDILLNIFERAFTEDDNVELWLMCDNVHLSEKDNQEWIKMYKSSKLGNKINIIKRVQTHEEVAHIIPQMDCGVFISRAEGWNMELLECLSCGLQCITTDYSGHTEYVNQDNCFLIKPTEQELAYDGIWFNGQGKWAKISDENQDLCVEYMRFVHKNKKKNEFGIETASKFTWENSAFTLKNTIEKIDV